MSVEGVSEKFDAERFLAARARAWELLHELASFIRPGHTTAAVGAELKQLLKRAGVAKQWHPPQLRLGRDTMCPFNADPLADEPLRENDIFFLDLGLLIDGHETDVGKAFVIGEYDDASACAQASEEVHREGVAYWRRTKCSGVELYRFAKERAAARGFELSLDGASGHRLGDFPHHVFSRLHLRKWEAPIAPERWVFEVHLIDPRWRFGAFYEDLLA